MSSSSPGASPVAAAAAAGVCAEAAVAPVAPPLRFWTIEIRRSAKDVKEGKFYYQDCMLCESLVKQTRRVCTCIVSNNGVRDRNGPSYAKDKSLICGAAVCTDCVVRIAEVDQDSDDVMNNDRCPYHIGEYYFYRLLLAPISARALVSHFSLYMQLYY